MIAVVVPWAGQATRLIGRQTWHQGFLLQFEQDATVEIEEDNTRRTEYFSLVFPVDEYVHTELLAQADDDPPKKLTFPK